MDKEPPPSRRDFLRGGAAAGIGALGVSRSAEATELRQPENIETPLEKSVVIGFVEALEAEFAKEGPGAVSEDFSARMRPLISGFAVSFAGHKGITQDVPLLYTTAEALTHALYAASATTDDKRVRLFLYEEWEKVQDVLRGAPPPPPQVPHEVQDA